MRCTVQLTTIHSAGPAQMSSFSHMPCTLPWASLPHIHQSSHEIIFSPQNHILLSLPGHIMHLNSGSLVMIPAGTPHAILPADEETEHQDYYSLSWKPAPFHANDSETVEATYISLSPYASLIQSLFDQACQLIPNEKDTPSEELIWAVTALLEISLHEFDMYGEHIEMTYPLYANDILKYLAENIYNKIRIQDVCEHFNLSQAHIYRLFNNTYHISPIQYLIACRMRQARLFLTENKSIPWIAKKLTYVNTNHFLKAFKKFYGCTPDDYFETYAYLDS